MKKFLLILLTVLSALFLCLGLAACDGKSSESGTLGDSGTTPSGHTHTYAETWSSDESGHWHAATCSHFGERGDVGTHTYENGKCTTCDYEHVGHTFAEYSDKTDDGHTGTCSVCGVVTEEHSYTNGKCTTCDYEHESHAFTYSEKTDDGHTGTCSVCQKTVTEEHSYDAQYQCEECDYQHTHTFAEEWESNQKGHWHTATCHPEATSEVTEHIPGENEHCTVCNYDLHIHTYDVNNRCTGCGNELEYTKTGLTYTLNRDKETYSVSWDDRTALDHVVIPYGYEGKLVTSIGSSAFYNCKSLASVTIGDSVTSIGYRAFARCSSLASVNIPDGVTSIRENAFEGCSSLESIKIPDSVTSIGEHAFDGTAYYNDRSHWDASGVLYIGNHLISAGASGSYTIRASTITVAKFAFEYCSSLTSIEIPDSVTSIGKPVFSGCSSLTSIEVAQGNPVYHSDGNCLIETESKTLIAGCKTSKIPSDGSVTSIGSLAFSNCSSLESIELPDSVTSIGNSAFNRCSSLSSITIPNSVTEIGDFAFDLCILLESVALGNGMTSIGINAFGYCRALESVTIENGLISIGDYAFYDCSSLTSIEIPDSVTSIGQAAFGDCSALESVTIGNGVSWIREDTFDCCSALTSVIIGNSVTWIGGGAFYGCSSLTSIQYKGTLDRWQLINLRGGWDFNTGDYTIVCTDGTIDKSGNVTKNPAAANVAAEVALCPPAAYTGKE